MKSIPRRDKMIIIGFAAAGIVLAVLQVIAAWLHYETDVSLYEYGAMLPRLLNILLVIYVLACFALCFVLKKKDHPETAPAASFATRVVSLCCTLALMICGIGDLYSYMNPPVDGLPAELGMLTGNMVHDKQDTFSMWAGIFAVIACVYFALQFVYPDRKAKLKTWFGCGVIGWHIFYLLAIYFDMTGPLNDPLRLIEEFALVASMMFITAEIRFSLRIAKKIFYISLALISVTFLCAVSVTGIVLSMTGKLPMSLAVSGHAFELVMAVYILTRLISHLSHEEEITELPEETAEEPNLLIQ